MQEGYFPEDRDPRNSGFYDYTAEVAHMVGGPLYEPEDADALRMARTFVGYAYILLEACDRTTNEQLRAYLLSAVGMVLGTAQLLYRGSELPK